MKKQIYSLVVCLSLTVLASAVVLAAGSNKTFALRTGDAGTGVQGVTFASSNVDTLKLFREAGVSAYSMTINWADSVSITDIIGRRVVNGTMQAVLAGDTLLGTFASTANGGASKSLTIVLQPMPEQYWFFVTYAGSANGVTSNNVRYSVQRNYSK